MEIPTTIGYQSTYFPTASSGSTTISGATTSSGGSFLSSSTGQSLISSGISSLFNIGGTLLASSEQKKLLKQQAEAQAKLLQGQKELALINLENTKIQSSGLSGVGGAGASGNTLLYVGLGVGAVVILGVVIFSVTRKN